MKIHKATYDQTHNKFGHRAGSQCVSNSFSFLHTAFLKGIDYVLTNEALDAIMEEGATLDSETEQKLLKSAGPGAKLPQFRLGGEIPKLIKTRFGNTGHALSRPFNGTLETQNLDGFICYGIHDFLRYASKKRKPVCILMIVDALARAIFMTENGNYIFDPHMSTQSDQAAVYECESLDEMVLTLTAFGIGMGSFYYDAMFVFLIDLTSPVTVNASDAEIAAISYYMDPDMALPTIVTSKLQHTQDHIHRSNGKINNTDSFSFTSRTPRKRSYPTPSFETRLPNSSRSKSKKSRFTDVSLDPNTFLSVPSLKKYEETVTEFQCNISQYVLKSSPTSSWMLYSLSGLPFESEFLEERAHHLMAQGVNYMANMETWHVDCTQWTPTLQRRKELMAKHFRCFIGFSNETKRFVQLVLRHNLNLITLYNNYFMTLDDMYRKQLLPLDAVLANKMNVVFSKWGEDHGNATKNWIKDMLYKLRGTPIDDIDDSLDSFLQRHPIPILQDYICLRRSDRNLISDLIEKQQRKLYREYRNKVNTYLSAKQFIEDVHMQTVSTEMIHVPPVSLEATPIALSSSSKTFQGSSHRTERPIRHIMFKDQPRPIHPTRAAVPPIDITMLDLESIERLKQQGNDKLNNIVQELQVRLLDIIVRHNNAFVTGSVPEAELDDLVVQIKNAQTTYATLLKSELCNPIDGTPLESLLAGTLYLKNGRHTPGVEIHDEVKEARKRFEDAIRIRDAYKIKVNDLLEVIEATLKDPSSLQCDVTMNIVKQQLQELDAMDLTHIPHAAARKQTVYTKLNGLKQEEDRARSLVNSLALDSLPSIQQINNHYRLKPLLHDDLMLREHFILRMLNAFDVMITRIARGDEPPKDSLLEILRHLVALLPQDNPQSNFVALTNDLFSQLVLRIRTFRANRGKQTPEVLEDLINFFVINNDSLRTIMNMGCGNNLPDIYNIVKKDLQTYLLSEEKAKWCKMVKDAVIDSDESLSEIIRTAPTNDVIEEMRPEIQNKVRKYILADQQRREKEKEELRRNAKKMALTELQRTVSAFTSNPATAIASADLTVARGALQSLHETERNELVLQFNNSLSKLLNSTDKDLRSMTDNCISAVLNKHIPKTKNHQCSQASIDETIGAFEALSTNVDLLTVEIQGHMGSVLKRLRFVQRAYTFWQDQDIFFDGTEYENQFRMYLDALQRINDHNANIQNALEDKVREYDEMIRKSTSLVNEKQITITRTDLSLFFDIHEYMDTALRDTAFQTVLENNLKTKKSILEVDINTANSGLKTTVEIHNARLTSCTVRWRNLVINQKMRPTEGFDIDTKRLLTTPIDTLISTIRLATESLPYIHAEKALRWCTTFIETVLAEICQEPRIAQISGSKDHYEELQIRIRETLQHIEDKLRANAVCENIVSELHTTGNTSAVTINNMDLLLDDLDPKRVAGGPTRHKALRDMLANHRQFMSCLQEYEKLKLTYFDTLVAISEFKYGFDFAHQRSKITELKTAFRELSKRHELGDMTGFPQMSSNGLLNGSVAGFLKGLDAMEKRVTMRQTYLEHMVSKQPLVTRSVSNVPFSFPPLTATAVASTDTNARLQFSPEPDVYYEVQDVFGKTCTVTGSGVPISLKITYGNIISKYFAIHKGNVTLKDSAARARNVVTARYKAVTVTVAISCILKSFWKQISEYDLKRLLTPQEHQQTHVTGSQWDPSDQSIKQSEVNVLGNLKTFAYVMITSWILQQSRPSNKSSGEHLQLHKVIQTLENNGDAVPLRGPTTIVIDPMEFCMILATIYPEYAYGVTKASIQDSLNHLLNHLDHRAIIEALTVCENPPPQRLDDVKGYCIDPRTWQGVQCHTIMWDSAFMRQLTSPITDSINTRKLLMYALATLILPSDILQCVWLELRPKYADRFHSIHDFVQYLLNVTVNTYDINRDVPSTQEIPILPSGEKILFKIVLTKKDSHDDLLYRFSTTVSVLDYIVGSFLFGIPITCCILVADVISGTRRLLARHVENTIQNQDFQKVLRSRDLNLGYLLDATWTNTLMEHSWMTLQLKKLREHLQQPPLLDYIPLILYTPGDNYVKHTLRPPPIPSHPLQLDVYLENPFPLLPVDDSIPLPCDFTRVPINADFLSEAPPPLKTHTMKTQISADASGLSTVPTDTLKNPIFQQQPVKTIALKDDVTTVSPSAASADFDEHPMIALTRTITKAVMILRTARQKLGDLTATIEETMKRLRILYLY